MTREEMIEDMATLLAVAKIVETAQKMLEDRNAPGFEDEIDYLGEISAQIANYYSGAPLPDD